MERNGRITIACAADGGYVLPLAAMVRSALATLDPERSTRLFVVDCGIDERDRERLLASWEADRVEVVWTVLDASRLAGLPLWGRMSAATYARLFLHEMLPPGAGRVIWLDCDMIVVGDLARLWDRGMGGQTVLAVQDLVVPYACSRYGIAARREMAIPDSAPYFNAGVMVVDLGAWREERVAERALAYLRRYWRRVSLLDQEGLNVALHGRWGALDPRWNMIASVSGRAFFTPEHLDRRRYLEAAADPWIVHYAGTLKPWVMGKSNRFRRLYLDRLEETAWAGWRPPGGARAAALRAYDAALRDHLYPLERLWVAAARLATRRRSTSSSACE